MRVKYYALTLRQMNFKKSFVFFLIFLILIIISINIFLKKIEPTIKKICSNNARNIAIKCSNDAIYKNIENVTYDKLVNINKDENGRITSINANSVEINKLITKITTDIEENLQNSSEGEVTLPLGLIFNENILSRIRSEGKTKNISCRRYKN